MTAEARVTNIGIQADVKEKEEVLLSNFAIQAEVFAPPFLVRATNFGIQVEFGEYYLTAKPLRTRPVPAKARVFPVYANARVTGIP